MSKQDGSNNAAARATNGNARLDIDELLSAEWSAAFNSLYESEELNVAFLWENNRRFSKDSCVAELLMREYGIHKLLSNCSSSLAPIREVITTAVAQSPQTLRRLMEKLEYEPSLDGNTTKAQLIEELLLAITMAFRQHRRLPSVSICRPFKEYSLDSDKEWQPRELLLLDRQKRRWRPET
jgi:hypothetical protein